MKKCIFILFAVLIGEICSAQGQRSVSVGPANTQGEARYALVIGNSSYTTVSSLNNPQNDAALLIKTLQQLGFKVMPGYNLTKQQMEEKISQFSDQLQRNSADKVVGLFYFAGHGVQVENTNYLVPIDDDNSKLTDIKYKCVQLDWILEVIGEARNFFNIVILDACRDNPFKSGTFRSVSRGLAQPVPLSEMIIEYAAKAGERALDGEGKNSPFAEELAAAIVQPGFKVEDAFKQVMLRVKERTQGKQSPGMYSQFTGNFSFITDKPETQQPVPPGPGAAGMDLNKYKNDATNLAALKQQWQTWQEKMSASYREVQSLDAENNFSSQKKAQMWKEFSDSYKDDNPYSQDDETLRSKANERMIYWNNFKPPKPVTQAPIVSNTNIETGAVTDIDGNVYKTVKIGSQVWMAENLKVTHYRNGDAIPLVTDDGEWKKLTTEAYCNYDNNEANAATYGRLYNGYAVIDRRNIAPLGWHVPSDTEWETLVNYLGGSSVAGGKMKVIGTGLWNSPNTDATNQSGFSALPGGYRDYSNGSYYYVGSNTGFWSSVELDSNYAWYRYLSCICSVVYRRNTDTQSGLSVRCVRDN